MTNKDLIEVNKLPSMGDLYMSIADYSFFESINEFDYTFYIDLLFRRRIYVEESIFFIKGLRIANMLQDQTNHAHEALKQGIIVPLTKTNVESFEEMASLFPHIQRGDESLRPKTLYENMLVVAQHYDHIYETAFNKLTVRPLSKQQTRYYNDDLKTILQSPEPPFREEGGRIILLDDLWKKTERFRYDWVNEVLERAMVRDLASAPKTDFNLLGAKLMGIEYDSLKQLIAYGPQHQNGAEVVAFLRWVHEIFYYSRARATHSATTYALRQNHVTVPFLYSMKEIRNTDADAFFECDVKFPTLEALASIDSRKFLALRNSDEGQYFMKALGKWQLTGKDADQKSLEEALSDYTRVICEAAKGTRDKTTLEKVIVFGNSSLGHLIPFFNTVKFMTSFAFAAGSPLLASLGALSSAADSTGNSVLSISIIDAAYRKLLGNQMLKKRKVAFRENRELDFNVDDTLISC